jgi:HEPN domain-containing protein
MKGPNNWFDFAADDIKSGEILLREGMYNMACFHAQQGILLALLHPQEISSSISLRQIWLKR